MFIPKTQLSFWKTSLVRFFVISVFTLVALQGTPTPMAWAEEENPAEGMGIGVASFVATIPYGCIKLAYASLGAIIGGFTYLLTGANEEAASKVWDQTMKGTYVLTPAHLAGEEPIRFMGP